MERMIIAYCRDNMELARTMDEQLSRIGLSFEHVTNVPGQPLGQFVASLQHSQSPVFLLFTDNLLRNLNCMVGLTDTVKSLMRSGRLLPIVADGIRVEEATAEVHKVATKFDKVIYTIQYLNHWQSAYLETNAQIEHLTEPQRSAAVDKAVQIRLVSEQISDLLSTVKGGEYFLWDDFKRNHYELFFQKFGLMEWHTQFKALQTKSKSDVEAPIAIQASDDNQLSDAPEITGSASVTPVHISELIDQDTKAQDLESKESVVSTHQQAAWKRIAEEIDDDEIMDNEIVDDEDELGTSDHIPSASVSAENHVEKPEEIPSNQVAATSPANYIKHISEEKKRILALFALGEKADGILTAKNLMLSHPDDDGLRFFYAQQLALHTDQGEEADKILSELQQRHFPKHKIMELHGDLAFQAKDPISAKEWWENALEVEPDSAQIHLKLGEILETHFKGAKRKAANHYRYAAELMETNAKAWVKHGELMLEYLDKPKKASKSYQKATKIEPENAEAWYGLALSAHHAGESKLATEAYQKAVALQISLRSDVLDKLLIGKIQPAQQVEKPTVCTILITGATSGIGAATAQLFLSKGHRVIAVGRRDERLQELKNKLEETQKERLHTIQLDVRKQAEVAAGIADLPVEWQNIDILLNNAGLALGLSAIHEGSLDDWETMIDTNIKGVLYMTRAFAPGMVARKKGHIINVSSSAGKEVYPKGAVYCATKWAVEALTKGMRMDLHQHGIRVSQVSPGHVEETEFALTRFHGDADKARIYDDFKPLTAQDVANAIYFIATQPGHVNVQDVHMFGTQQASSTLIDRSGR